MTGIYFLFKTTGPVFLCAVTGHNTQTMQPCQVTA